MNRELDAMDVNTLLSVWPHFSQGTPFSNMLLDKGWLVHTRDGKPDSGGYKDVIRPNIDTTNPKAAKWFWEKIRDRYVKPYGFDYIWLDETEPDVDPAKDMFSSARERAFIMRIRSFIQPRCTKVSIKGFVPRGSEDPCMAFRSL